MTDPGQPAAEDAPTFWTWPQKASQLRPGQPRNAPGLVVVAGVDAISSGITVQTWRQTGAEWPSRKTLITRRWQQPLLTDEELVRIAVLALQEAYDGLWGPMRG